MLRKSEGITQERQLAVRVLKAALEAKDQYTGAHNQRVARFAEATARELGLGEETVEEARLAGSLHDIGKIGVADQVLRKAAPLDEAEWAEMKRHPDLGFQMLAGVPAMGSVADALRFHHEKIDGTGYPLGLRGTEIPLLARIISVADAFDAMVSHRPYRRGRAGERAMDEIRRCQGSQFDPLVVEAFGRVFARGEFAADLADLNKISRSAQAALSAQA